MGGEEGGASEAALASALESPSGRREKRTLSRSPSPPVLNPRGLYNAVELTFTCRAKARPGTLEREAVTG